MKTQAFLVAAVLMASAPVIQAQSTSKSFDVASIKPGDPNSRFSQTMMSPGGRIKLSNVTLRNMILQAYQLRDFQVSGGPSWIGTEHFDVMAKANDENVTPEQVRIMMQDLLATRFKLVFHEDTKEAPVYHLVVAKNGPKLTAANSDDTADVRGTPGGGGSPRVSFSGGGGGLPRSGRHMMNSSSITLGKLAEQLANTLGRPVIDKTGIDGKYDVKLEWTDSTAGADASDENLPTLFTVLQEKLGLKLESAKGPVKIVIVDSAEKPSEN